MHPVGIFQPAGCIILNYIFGEQQTIGKMKEKKVLVTGANKGIGFGVAKYLGLSGWKVVVGARDQERAEKAINQLQSLGIEVTGWVDGRTENVGTHQRRPKPSRRVHRTLPYRRREIRHHGGLAQTGKAFTGFPLLYRCRRRQAGAKG